MDAFLYGCLFGAGLVMLALLRPYRCLNDHCGFLDIETTPDVAPRAEQAYRQGLQLVLTDVPAVSTVADCYDKRSAHVRHASFLSDNAAVFSGRSRGAKVALELQLERLRVEVKHSTPAIPRPAARSSASTRP